MDNTDQSCMHPTHPPNPHKFLPEWLEGWHRDLRRDVDVSLIQDEAHLFIWTVQNIHHFPCLCWCCRLALRCYYGDQLPDASTGALCRRTWNWRSQLELCFYSHFKQEKLMFHWPKYWTVTRSICSNITHTSNTNSKEWTKKTFSQRSNHPPLLPPSPQFFFLCDLSSPTTSDT